jgi:CDP-glucose 4,6-dehydratase
MEKGLVSGLKALTGPVMITGHTGFKGTWMTLLLEELGIETVGISLPPTNDSLFTRLNRTGVIEEDFIDIRDFNSLDKAVRQFKPSAVFHMAAQPLVMESYKNPRETFETNVMGTANLLSIALSTESIRAVTVVTTDKVYKNENTGRRFVESDPLSGKDPYSASKVGTEAVVSAWQQIVDIEGGPKIVSVRAGNVIGGGDFAKNRLIPDLVRGVMSKNEVEIRNPLSTRPWQHVLDPLIGYIKAKEFLLGGGDVRHFNFGPSEKSLAVSAVVSIFKSHFGDNLKTKIITEETTTLMESTELDLDSSLAKNKLGWSPKLNQSQAIAKTAEWWKLVLNDNLSSLEACQSDIKSIFLTNKI